MRAQKNRKLTFVVVFVLLISTPVIVGSAHAETQYVSDMLILCLRAGPGDEYKVIRTLRSDTPVEVLEEDKGYLKVRTDEGEEGWVLKQYLSSNTPKPVIIAALKRDVKQLEGTVEKLENERTSLMNELETSKQNHAIRVKELEKECDEKSKEISRTTGELKQITDKYSIIVDESQNVVELVEQRDTLRTANNRLNKEVEHLRQENERLGRTRTQRWFLAGAGVFLIGLMFGSFSKKKRYYYK
jgi:SH3 domain protein